MYRLGPSTAAAILGEHPDIAVYGKLLSGGYLPLAATLTTKETFDAFLGKKTWNALLHGHSYTANPMACTAALESARLIEGGVHVELPQSETVDMHNNLPVGSNTWFDAKAFDGLGGVRPSFNEEDIRDLSNLPGVKAVMSLGSVLALELVPSFALHHSTSVSHGTGTTTGAGAGTGTGAGTGDAHTRYYNNQVSTVVVSLLKQNYILARPLGNIVYLMPSPVTPLAERQRIIRVLKRCVTKAFYLRQPKGRTTGWVGTGTESTSGAATAGAMDAEDGAGPATIV
jgi:Aminotransferase class-III